MYLNYQSKSLSVTPLPRHVCSCACPGKGIGFSVSGVTDSCKILDDGFGNRTQNLGFLQEQKGALSSAPISVS